MNISHYVRMVMYVGNVIFYRIEIGIFKSDVI